MPPLIPYSRSSGWFRWLAVAELIERRHVAHRTEMADRMISLRQYRRTRPLTRLGWSSVGSRHRRWEGTRRGLGGSPLDGSPLDAGSRSPGGRPRRVLEPDPPFTLIASRGNTFLIGLEAAARPDGRTALGSGGAESWALAQCHRGGFGRRVAPTAPSLVLVRPASIAYRYAVRSLPRGTFLASLGSRPMIRTGGELPGWRASALLAAAEAST